SDLRPSISETLAFLRSMATLFTIRRRSYPNDFYCFSTTPTLTVSCKFHLTFVFADFLLQFCSECNHLYKYVILTISCISLPIELSLYCTVRTKSSFSSCQCRLYHIPQIQLGWLPVQAGFFNPSTFS